MAPPTPVRTRQDIQKLYQKQLENPDKYQCTLKAITQSECTFKISEASNVSETICIPFRRVFQRCLDSYVTTNKGKKSKIERWVNIEVTDSSSNDVIKTRYSSEIQRFLQAEVDLAKWMETQAAQTDASED